MLTIAHFRTSKTLRPIAVSIFVTLLVPCVTIYALVVRHMLSSPRASFIIPSIVFAWISGAYVAFGALVGLKRLLFDGGRAVWLEKGRIIFSHSRLFSVPRDAIVRISISTDGQAVVMHLRDGREKRLPTGSLKESPKEIVDRISDLSASGATLA
jgi:hypothetical protein